MIDDETGITNPYTYKLIVLSGEMRAEELVPFLLPLLGKRANAPELMTPERWPVEQALIKIGKPASKEMTRIICEDVRQKRREMAAYVLLNIEGTYMSEFIIRKHLSETSDNEIKNRLCRSLEYFISAR